MNATHPTRAIAAFLATLLLVGATAGCKTNSEPGRVLLLGLDGMDPETVDLLMSEGKLPNFARLRQEGAYGRLASMKPLLARIADGSGEEGALDKATKGHIRNLDLRLERMAAEMAGGREQAVEELRSEIRLLTRTLAAMAEEG